MSTRRVREFRHFQRLEPPYNREIRFALSQFGSGSPEAGELSVDAPLLEEDSLVTSTPAGPRTGASAVDPATSTAAPAPPVSFPADFQGVTDENSLPNTTDPSQMPEQPVSQGADGGSSLLRVDISNPDQVSTSAVPSPGLAAAVDLAHRGASAGDRIPSVPVVNSPAAEGVVNVVVGHGDFNSDLADDEVMLPISHLVLPFGTSRRNPANAYVVAIAEQIVSQSSNRQGPATGRSQPILLPIQLQAVRSEVEQLIEQKVLAPVDVSGFPKSILYKALPSVMLITNKTTPAGEFIKVKARFVTKGFRDYDHPPNIQSPTVSRTLVVTALQLAVSLNLNIMTIDVSGAFLRAKLVNENRLVCVHISKELAPYILEANPSLAPGVMNDGSLIAKLQKALYGLKEAPRAWFECLYASLIKFGLKQSVFDECLFFNRTSDGSLLLVLTHVDDMLCIGLDRHLNLLQGYLQKEFEKITTHHDQSEMSYLGLTIRRFANHMELTQIKHIDKICEDLNIPAGAFATTPYGVNILDVNERSPRLDRMRYQVIKSVAASLQWISTTRPEVRVCTSFLLTRTEPTATEDDYKKLERVGRYLNATRELPFVLRKSRVVLRGSADASHACHVVDRFQGHTGGAIWIGERNAPIVTFCGRQRLTAHSSTEAELIAADTVVKTGLWLLGVLKEVGAVEENATFDLEQDNQSAIALLKKGRSSVNSRSVNVKYFWMHDKIGDGSLKLVDTRSNVILANGLTKGLTEREFVVFRDRILNKL